MAVTYPMQLPERLKQIMYERDISQVILAEELGVTQGTVSHWMNGRHEPRACHIIDMCMLFGVTADWLLGMDRML